MMQDGAKPEVDLAEINMSKIHVSDDFAGMLFAFGTMLIFLLGVPAIRYMFAAAVVFGCGLGLVFHFRRHEAPPSSCIPH